MENNTYEMPTRFGYEILRDHVLPSILGAHESDILYWSGKEIARKFPVFNIEELPSFFAEAGWGALSLKKQSKKDAFYILKDKSKQLNTEPRTFTLEAGFIAEQYQKLNGMLTECYAELKPKENGVQFHVKWDPKSEL